MTDFREPPINHYGLEISMTTDELKKFYLTGEKPLFKVRIHNTEKKNIEVHIILVWKLESVRNEHNIDINISPEDTKEYELPREWCFVEGTARYYLLDIGSPEAKHDEETLKKLKEKKEIHPLCSYYIYNREIYEHENMEREERQKFDRSMYQYTRSLNLYTVIILIFTILIFLKDMNFIQYFWLVIKNGLSGGFNFITAIIGFIIAMLTTDTTMLIILRTIFQIVGASFVTSELVGFSILEKIINIDSELQNKIKLKTEEKSKFELYIIAMAIAAIIIAFLSPKKDTPRPKITQLTEKIFGLIYWAILKLNIYGRIFKYNVELKIIHFFRYLTDKIHTEKAIGILGVISICISLIFQAIIDTVTNRA